MSTGADPLSAETITELWRRFSAPPDDARPRAWWHWMDGNVDPAGIVRDLEWLHAVGVRGVQLFDGGMGTPLVVPEPVRPESAAWDEAVRVAASTCARLGLEFAVATSAGWSAAGAPWVTPADAMKKIVWSECVVVGVTEPSASPRNIVLPPLPDIAGLYQDAHRWGAQNDPRWSTDWRVIAFPDADHLEALTPSRVLAPVTVSDPTALTDGSFADGIALPRDPDGPSQSWITYEFDEPVTASAVTLGLPGPRGFGAAPPATAVLEAMVDGDFVTLAMLAGTSLPVRSATFTPVTATAFRLTLSAGAAADALPPMAPGIATPPVLRRAETFVVSQFALRTGGRVHHAETKAGFGVEQDYYSVDTPPLSGADAVSGVIDVTEHLRGDELHWHVPPGRWRVIRIGASLTGHTNGPAPSDQVGLEVDKLDGHRVRAFIERSLQRFTAAGDGIHALLSDSIESGPQNWTDDIASHFSLARGYDLTPWLPALTGIVVRDAAATDRFLHDYRTTIAELLADEYYGALAGAAHERGLSYYAEALEDQRPQLGDDLAMRARADVPMGAMWTFANDAGPRPTYVADLKGASSVAHVYGKAWTGAEAFTCFDQPWASTPATLKPVADLQLSLGVTRFCIHASPHQPMEVPPPGIALAPFLGQAFTVHEPWQAFARPWIDYLARCSALLSVGRPAVDVAVFTGEEAPITALFGTTEDRTLPPGYDFDYVSPDALHGVLSVADGELHAVGASYRAIVLGGSSDRLSCRTLRRLVELAEAGATVIGRAPTSSPSLADEPGEFERLRERLWGAGGLAVGTDDPGATLASLGILPTVRVRGAEVRTIARLVDGHRITFMANPTNAPITVEVTTQDAVLSAWDPVSVTTTVLQPEDPADTDDAADTGHRHDGVRHRFTVTLPPSGSVFLVPSIHQAMTASATPADGETHQVVTDWSLAVGDGAPIDLPGTPVRWSELGSTRLFTGTGTYRATFTSPVLRDGDRAVIDLGAVDGVAEVSVNGRPCGIAWTAPYRIEVTDALDEASAAAPTVVEVAIANTWRNRLIADSIAPSDEIFAPMRSVFTPTAEPLPSGLAGPVHVTVTARDAPANHGEKSGISTAIDSHNHK